MRVGPSATPTDDNTEDQSATLTTSAVLSSRQTNDVEFECVGSYLGGSPYGTLDLRTAKPSHATMKHICDMSFTSFYYQF
jgi:hypothetical protein